MIGGAGLRLPGIDGRPPAAPLPPDVLLRRNPAGNGLRRSAPARRIDPHRQAHAPLAGVDPLFVAPEREASKWADWSAASHWRARRSTGSGRSCGSASGRTREKAARWGSAGTSSSRWAQRASFPGRAASRGRRRAGFESGATGRHERRLRTPASGQTRDAGLFRIRARSAGGSGAVDVPVQVRGASVHEAALSALSVKPSTKRRRFVRRSALSSGYAGLGSGTPFRGFTESGNPDSGNQEGQGGRTRDSALQDTSSDPAPSPPGAELSPPYSASLPPCPASSSP